MNFPPAKLNAREALIDMTYQNALLTEALELPGDLIGYEISRKLTDLFPDAYLLEGADSDFDLKSFEKAKLCLIEQDEAIHNQVLASFDREEGLQLTLANGAYDVSWGGKHLRVLLSTFQRGGCCRQHFWIMADDRETAERFFCTVCEWNSEIREEVLLFHGGYWRKDADLFTSIKSSTFENLILDSALKSELREDLERFIASRPVYEKYKIPWKRGVLLVGPPGNGKTHTIKALINVMKLPCLYVKSIIADGETDHTCIRDLFERARKSTPCILVFEDLDSLINDGNRSYFLNELDGFAENSGLITIASTNHPDRLDSAILSRPSRFDRKYHFPLPAFLQREEYLRMWNGTLEPELKIDEDSISAIATETDGFSFAYMKELILSSLLTWIKNPVPGRFGATALDSVSWLSEQMRSPKTQAPSEVD